MSDLLDIRETLSALVAEVRAGREEIADLRAEIAALRRETPKEPPPADDGPTPMLSVADIEMMRALTTEFEEGEDINAGLVFSIAGVNRASSLAKAVRTYQGEGQEIRLGKAFARASRHVIDGWKIQPAGKRNGSKVWRLAKGG